MIKHCKTVAGKQFRRRRPRSRVPVATAAGTAWIAPPRAHLLVLLIRPPARFLRSAPTRIVRNIQDAIATIATTRRQDEKVKGNQKVEPCVLQSDQGRTGKVPLGTPDGHRVRPRNRTAVTKITVTAWPVNHEVKKKFNRTIRDRNFSHTVRYCDLFITWFLLLLFA